MKTQRHVTRSLDFQYVLRHHERCQTLHSSQTILNTQYSIILSTRYSLLNTRYCCCRHSYSDCKLTLFMAGHNVRKYCTFQTIHTYTSEWV